MRIPNRSSLPPTLAPNSSTTTTTLSPVASVVLEETAELSYEAKEALRFATALRQQPVCNVNLALIYMKSFARCVEQSLGKQYVSWDARFPPEDPRGLCIQSFVDIYLCGWQVKTRTEYIDMVYLTVYPKSDVEILKCKDTRTPE